MVQIYGRVVRQDDAGIVFDLAARVDGGTSGRVLFERGAAKVVGQKYGWDVLAVTRDAVKQLHQGYHYVTCHRYEGEEETQPGCAQA